MFVLQAVDTLLEHGANPSLRLSRGVGSALCAATSFMAERRRTPAGRIKLVSSQLISCSFPLRNQSRHFQKILNLFSLCKKMEINISTLKHRGRGLI